MSLDLLDQIVRNRCKPESYVKHFRQVILEEYPEDIPNMEQIVEEEITRIYGADVYQKIKSTSESE